jgi:uncharacterized protein YkwD
MAVPSRYGRHSAAPARRRLPAPLLAFLAVVLVAGAGWWVTAQAGGTAREAGLLAETRDRAGLRPDSADGSRPAPADRASRDGKPPALTTLGPIAPDTGARGTRPAPPPRVPTTAPTTTRARTSSPAPPAGRPPAPPRPTGTTSPPGAASSAEAEVTRLVNIQRANAGCGALRVDDRLTAAARAHSRDMVDRDYFGHTSPDGKGPGDRAAAAGYPRWSGENIAAGYPTPQAVVDGWMNSAGHKANILNCQSKATGVGYDARGNMWTQMFGFA